MLPEAFSERMRNLLGEEYEPFLDSLLGENYHALRLNALKTAADGESAAMKRPGFLHLTPVSWARDGYYYEKEDQPGRHPCHEAGVYYIQEPSAMAPVTLLDPQPGERILDLCAAPGGKSTQIAAAMQGGGLLICNEVHSGRAKILSENVERMGIRNACVTNEPPERLAEVFPGYFDRVLADAPCSGEGMFRKDKAACEEWSEERVRMCAERQDGILDCAARMLRPGGRLVYSTCTFAPLENEGSVSRFLHRHPEFALRGIPRCELGIGEESAGVPEWADNPVPGLERTLRLWPHRVKGEGHYAAVLEKEGAPAACGPALSSGGLQKGIPDRELREYREFEKSLLCRRLEGEFLRFGDNLYLMPEGMPNLKGLKALRPGLHVGTLKKNRFEPSHALALALAPGDAVHILNLPSEGDCIRAYLDGQTFPADGEKGWYLVCVDGFGTGWGKLAGGVMKNHYPRGLRKRGSGYAHGDHL